MKLTAGGPNGSDQSDEQIARTDISPEDIRKMSKEEIHQMLAGLRGNRADGPKTPKKARVAKSPQDSVETIDDDIGEEDME